MKSQLQNHSYLSKSTASSHRGSRTQLPIFTQTQDAKFIIREYAPRKIIADSSEEYKKYSSNPEQSLKSHQSLETQPSQKLNSSSYAQQYSRARSATTYNESGKSQFDHTLINKPKSAGLFILRRSTSRKRYQKSPQISERSSISKGQIPHKGSVYEQQDNILKQSYERKEKGWDHYRDQLQKEIQRSGSIQAERASHLTTTPLIYHKNYFERRREIEYNLNCKEFGLNVQNYSILDKKTKSFFHNQNKEEAIEFHDIVKKNEKKLNSEINDIIHLSILNTRTKLVQKYSISKHLEQNRLAQSQVIC